MSNQADGGSTRRALRTLANVAVIAFGVVVIPHEFDHSVTAAVLRHGVEQAGFALVGVIVGIWLHEFAHAAAVLLFRQRLRGVRIGAGPVVLRVRRVEVRLLPSHGLTARNPGGPRWQSVVIVAAGPVTNLVVAALAATVLADSLEPATVAIVVTQAYQGVMNLLPADSRIAAGGTDGKQLVRLLRRQPVTLTSTDDGAQSRKVRLVATALINQGRPDEARAMLQERLVVEPSEIQRGMLERQLRDCEAAPSHTPRGPDPRS